MTFAKNPNLPDSVREGAVSARLLALVGMPGSGKSLLAEHLQAKGYPKVRFGGITIDEVLRRGWDITPQNERVVREEIRANEGMDAYAQRALPIIHTMLAEHQSAIIDGLYSFSEYKTLKEEFGPSLVVVAVICDRPLRYQRVAEREERPLTPQEAEWRDITEIETLEKGGPIAIADYMILNNGAKKDILTALDQLLIDLDLNV